MPLIHPDRRLDWETPIIAADEAAVRPMNLCLGSIAQTIPMDDLTLTTMPLRDGCLLRINGALSLGRVPFLEPMTDRLMASPPQRFVVDLTGCVYLSSLAIGRLLTLCDDIDEAGGRVFIACNRTNVMRMLLLCRAELVATIVPTIEDAIVGVGLAEMLDAA